MGGGDGVPKPVVECGFATADDQGVDKPAPLAKQVYYCSEGVLTRGNGLQRGVVAVGAGPHAALSEDGAGEFAGPVGGGEGDDSGDGQLNITPGWVRGSRCVHGILLFCRC